MIENENLKYKLKLRDDKIMELNKDLLHYQKKTKMFMDLESRIDEMVGENI